MKKAVLIGVVLLLTACTQAGTIVAQKPIPSDLPRSSTVGVIVMSSKSVATSDLQTLETSLAERLTSVGRFRKVSAQSVAPDDTHDLTLLVDVITLPKGSIWDYSFFGEGEVKFDVKLIERANGQVIGAGVVNGEASRGILGRARVIEPWMRPSTRSLSSWRNPSRRLSSRRRGDKGGGQSGGAPARPRR